MDWMQYGQRIILMRLEFCCESVAPFLCMFDKRRMQRILKLLTWCSCSCVYKLSGWLIGLKQCKHVFSQLSTPSEHKKQSPAGHQPGYGDERQTCAAEIRTISFWIWFSDIIPYHPTKSCSWIPTMVLKRLFKASFTHFHQFRYVETYWNPKRTAGKAKSINFQTSHFQAAKLQRVPPEQLGPWSFNQHLHWHRTSSDHPFFPQNPESINIQDKSRCVCLCLFWTRGSLATFLVSWTWSRMVGTRLKPIQNTAQSWQSESHFDGMRHTGDLMILYVVICCLYHISAETPWHRISLNDLHVTSGKVATVYELRRSLQGAITQGNLGWFCL